MIACLPVSLVGYQHLLLGSFLTTLLHCRCGWKGHEEALFNSFKGNLAGDEEQSSFPTMIVDGAETICT
jgi:hypothetical protein